MKLGFLFSFENTFYCRLMMQLEHQAQKIRISASFVTKCQKEGAEANLSLLCCHTYSIDNISFFLSLFIPPNLPLYPMFFKFMASFSLLSLCVCVFVPEYKNKTCSFCMLLTRMFSGLIIWCALPWGRLSCSQHSLVASSSLSRVEDSWLPHPHRCLHVYWCCPCLDHVLAGCLIRLRGCGFSDISSRQSNGKPNIPLALKIFPPLFLNGP